MAVSLFSGIWPIMRRELQLLLRSPQDLANPLLFYVLIVSLFPLAISPDPKFLSTIAAGVIWTAALLANLLALDALFKHDFDNGYLEQLALSPQPLALNALAKVFVFWLLTGLPLALMSPLLALMMQLPTAAIPALIYSLLLGTPILALLGSVGSALTVASGKGGILLSLLVLPLTVPVLIFGAQAVQFASTGLPYSAQLAFLAALLMLSLVLVPWATAAALRVSLSG